jgi:tetratricopeptide (TPR) repeat protein
MGFLDGYKKKKTAERAHQLLLEGRKKLPKESLQFFSQAREMFLEVGDNFMAQVVEAEYYKALGKLQLHSSELRTALENFNRSKAIFLKLRMYEEAGSVSKCIWEVHRQLGDLDEMKKTVRIYLNAIDLKKIDFEEASRMCNALDIDGDTLNAILTDLEEEGLLRYVGDGYVVIKEDIKRIEIVYGQKSPLVEALKCPICNAPIDEIKNTTKCKFCGVNLKINSH